MTSLALSVSDPSSTSDWDASLARLPDAQIFHTSAWARVLIETYGHKPFYLRWGSASQVEGVLPFLEVKSSITGRRAVCVPFSDFCAPLIESEQGGKELLRAARSLCQDRRWKYFELRGAYPSAPETSPESFCGHVIELKKPLQEMWDSLDEAVQRAIRKAEKSGVSCEISRDRKDLMEFWQLHLLTRKRHGVPVQPKNFFRRVQEHLLDKGFGFVALARKGRRAVAGAVILRFGHNSIYKFGASDALYQEYRGNNLVIWNIIQHLSRTGATQLHFGRTHPSNNGLRRFKMGWGAREHVLPYFRVDPNGSSTPAVSLAPGAFSSRLMVQLPLSLNRLAGALIYPHLD